MLTSLHNVLTDVYSKRASVCL